MQTGNRKSELCKASYGSKTPTGSSLGNKLAIYKHGRKFELGTTEQQIKLAAKAGLETLGPQDWASPTLPPKHNYNSKLIKRNEKDKKTIEKD